MKEKNLTVFSAIPQPPREQMEFIGILGDKRILNFSTPGIDAGIMKNRLREGVCLNTAFPEAETAWESLLDTLAQKQIPISSGGYRIDAVCDSNLAHEEYIVDIGPAGTCLTAGDADGMRRAIYFLEDRLCEAEEFSVTPGCRRRRPYVRHRISRCFFGPTYRPPFFIDELTNDINYYPDEYLDKLAHDGINGLWLSMYFKDIPSSLYPEHGQGWAKRCAKLARTAERCRRYGIRLYIYFCEPKFFGGGRRHSLPFHEADIHPEVKGSTLGNTTFFCTSNETGRRYIAESVSTLFQAVPALGGIINIMFGEDNGSCISRGMLHDPEGHCPVCSSRIPGEVFAETARLFKDAMHPYNPGAEFIGWFYTPMQRDGSPMMHALEQIAACWPEDCSIMFNFESGGTTRQLGKERHVFDYSLAYVGPSELFRRVAAKAGKTAAKLQVGCSHENASIPFMPVPSNLYEKYRELEKYDVGAVMQCWYFGNYPGIMNKAAGELAFRPFPRDEDEFLMALARPLWRRNAAKVVEAWKFFKAGYRNFPANLAFAWYGPLHHSIAWPLHLFPADAPIAPSWLLENFPTVSGDRIGETLNFMHTLHEALELCRKMSDEWNSGVEIMESLRGEYAGNRERLEDINLAEAISLQMRSTVNVLNFYRLREDMFYNREDNLDVMRGLVVDEIANSRRMAALCIIDSRLGYHSEAEGYLFFPEKLQQRVRLLEELLEDDFPRFDMNAGFIDEYTGRRPRGAVFDCRPGHPVKWEKIGGSGICWTAFVEGRTLFFRFNNPLRKEITIELEPCRCWAAIRLDVADGKIHYNHSIYRTPGFSLEEGPDGCRQVGISLEILDGFRRPGFPMRLELSCGKEGWVQRTPWPERLMHRSCNPASAGWIFID